MGTGVYVGSGVNVLLGVFVKVAVGGMATIVCVAAAAAVCATYSWTAFELRVGAGFGMDGTHAVINVNTINQPNMFVLWVKFFSKVQGLLFHNFLYASHLPILQADLDAMRMVWGLGKDIFYHAFGQFTCTLILF